MSSLHLGESKALKNAAAQFPPIEDISAAVDVGKGRNDGHGGGDTEIVAGVNVNTPQVSSRHWQLVRRAVVTLAAFQRRRVKAADFERIKLFGEGGSGLVYLVKLKDTSMYFALKVQRKLDLQAKEKRIRRALIEREVLVACAHPFVCSLYTAFQDSRHLYLLMDFCAGGDLTTLIRDIVKRPLRENEARFYVSEIVAALEWVHLHGYVYRDLKPENVLIHESGHIRLGDFGTAERGCVECSRPMSEKFTMEEPSREEVEKKLVQSKNVMRTVGGKMAGLTGEVAVKHQHETEDDEDDADEDMVGFEGDLDKTLGCKSIVVGIDPLLEKSNRPIRPKNHDGHSFVPAFGGDSSNRGPKSLVKAPPQEDAEMSYSHYCLCKKMQSGSKAAESSTAQPSTILPAYMQTFSRGRGSVKLNVFLDSQTFIGTADFMAPEMVTGKDRQGTAMDWWALGVMLYEMMLGTLPFNTHIDQSSNGVFRSIVNAKLTFPRRHKMSRAAVGIIQELLRKNPTQRLGERKGVGEIKRHPFFTDTHWALLAHVTPPFKVSGPDTPGWIESITSAPSRSRDDKMATWTWNVTDDGSRPASVIADPASITIAQKLLERESISEHSSKTKASLSAQVKNKNAKTGSTKASSVGNSGGKNTSSDGVEGGNINCGIPSTCASKPVVPEASLPTKCEDQSEAAGVDTPREGSNKAVSPNDPDRAKIQHSKPEPATGTAAGARDVNTANFEGYDFNTLRRVGSFPVGTHPHNLPKLSARQSSDTSGGSRP